MKNASIILSLVLAAASLSAAPTSFFQSVDYEEKTISYLETGVLVEESTLFDTPCYSLLDIKVVEETVYFDEDDGLTCEISITVTGKSGSFSASATGKVSGPCDEMKAAAAALARRLIDQVKKELGWD